MFLEFSSKSVWKEDLFRRKQFETLSDRDILGKAVPHEVPVQVTDPLDVYGHHAAANRKLSVVTARRRNHVA